MHKDNDKIESENSLMGLSDLPRSQQSFFFNRLSGRYVIKFIGDQATIFNEISTYNLQHEQTQSEKNNLQEKKFKGILSPKTIKKIKQICETWNDTIYYHNIKQKVQGTYNYKKLGMITLTLSKEQKDSDNNIKSKLLNHFLISIKRIHPDLNYLWKAEPQRNGNIHFHILIDKYIKKETIQILWNQIQQLYNYHPQQKLNNNNKGQPSTRIESIKSKKNSMRYITKYISKNEGERKIKGRLWSCNEDLSNLKPYTYIINKDVLKELVVALIKKNSKFILDDYYIVIFNAHNIDLIKDSFAGERNIHEIIEQNLQHFNNTEIPTELQTQTFQKLDPEPTHPPDINNNT